jgi:hypothetical protein
MRRSGISTERAVVIAGALGILLIYLWIAQFDIDLVDEGYFMDLAARVVHGQIPYRDFDTYYTPGLFYLNAAVLSVFGASVVPVRWVMIVVRLACSVLMYRLGRRIAAWPFAAIPPLVLVAMDLSVVSHPAWPALLSVLLYAGATGAAP